MFSPVPISDTEFTWWVYQKPSLLCLKDSVLFHAWPFVYRAYLVKSHGLLQECCILLGFILKKVLKTFEDKKQRYYNMSQLASANERDYETICIYIYIYRKRRCETQQQIWRTKENLKIWTELAENLWWQKQAYWANTGNLKNWRFTLTNKICTL